jgi:hypothetical protein
MKKEGFGWVWGISGLMILAGIVLIFYSIQGVQFSPQNDNSHLACIQNSCSLMEGAGPNECFSEGAFCGCVDTDAKNTSGSGLNFFKQGTTRNSTSSQTDSCLVSGKLKEYYCGADEFIYSEISCESLGDYICFSGKCISTQSEEHQCTDTDGGISYMISGRANNGQMTIGDDCTADGLLSEAYCSPESEEVMVDLFDCSSLGNFVCEYGQCVSNV